MSRFLVVFVVLGALVATIPVQAKPIREARWAEVAAGQTLPAELADPEGRTRWDLSDLILGQEWTRVVESDPGAPGLLRRTDRGRAGESAEAEICLFGDRAGGATAERWLLPDRDPRLRDPAWAGPDPLTERAGEREERIWIESRRVGLGWLHLPEKPHEVVLQRVLIYRESSEDGDLVPDLLIHRWVDPREGLVAEIWGPASADGTTRLEIGGAAVVVKTLVGLFDLRIYADQIDRPLYEKLTYGFDRGAVPISVLTPDGHENAGDLVNATSWDFTPTNRANAIAESASTAVEVSAAETCSWDKCGFNRPGVKLGREDRHFDDPANLDTTTSVNEREDRAGDVTIWMRAGVNKEGQTGGLGEGESRLCYVDDGRTEVPLWRFSHEDPGVGWYLQLGDSWSHEPFDCENNMFNHVCPNDCGLGCPVYAKSRTGYSGTQTTSVINEGPVTLPSGHTFHALVARKVIEFSAYPSSLCFLKVQDVRTVVYLWEVPGLGTVARLMSAVHVDDPADFDVGNADEVVETDIKYGLFPPLSITVGAVTDDAVELSWNPGLDVERIDRYKIYWDTDSGAASPYAHSVTVPAGSPTPSAIIDPDPEDDDPLGTEYFFTVTSLSDFTDPASGVTTTYESVMYPVTVPADPVPLPVEVSATPPCTPTTEVDGVMVDKDGGSVEICWTASADSCLLAYEVLGADTPENPQNFAVIDEVPSPTVCTTLDPAETFFQVRVKGIGASGP
jgi:hypothetical protein